MHAMPRAPRASRRTTVRIRTTSVRRLDNHFHRWRCHTAVAVEEKGPLTVIPGHCQRQPPATSGHALQDARVPSEECIRLQAIPGMRPDQLLDRRDPITDDDREMLVG